MMSAGQKSSNIIVLPDELIKTDFLSSSTSDELYNRPSTKYDLLCPVALIFN